MTARSEFEDKVQSAFTRQHLANALNQFMHGLAEEIRQAADREMDYYTSRGMEWAADLIDPMKP